MKNYGIPKKLINLIKVFYGDFKCSVMEKGETSEWFDVKEGCNISYLLFLTAMDVIIKNAEWTDRNTLEL